MQRFQLLRRRNVLQRVAIWDARAHAQADVRSGVLASSTRSFSSLPDHEVVGMPALSPTMETGTIAKWLKAEGESVAAGDVICQIETDKAVVDFEAQDDLFLAKILQPEGASDIKVGEPIFVSVGEESDLPAFKSFSLENGASAEAAPTPAAAAAAPAAAAATPAPAPAASTPAASTPAATHSSGRVFASPLAKKVARESGVLLSAINGSGPHGRIIKADVDDAIARGPVATTSAETTAAPAAPAAASSAGVAAPQPIATHDYVDYPISADAQIYAQQLTQQKLEVPHFHLTVDLTLDKLLAARDRLNAGLSDDNKLSVNDFLVRAASLAMKKVPEVNSTWMGSFIRQYHDTSINVVVSTASGGSVAPVIANVNHKGLAEINASVRAIIAKANDQTLTAQDLANGTFTISNVGMYDVRSLAGIVSPNQSCFLGFGTIDKKVVPNDDPEATQIYKYAQVLTATLACDHRVVDGAVGAQWLAVYKELVEDPLKMIL